MHGDPASPPDPRPPTALFLIHDLGPGGAEKVYLAWLRRVRSVRAVPVLVRPRGRWVRDIPEELPLYHLGPGGTRPASRVERTDVYPAAAGGGPDGLVGGALSLLARSRRLARIARTESATLVSTFLHKSHAIALLARSLWHRELRVVANVHEDPGRHIETHFPASRRPLMRAYYRAFLPGADRIVAVADGVRDELVERFGIPAAKIDVVGNPVEPTAAGGRREPPPDDLPGGPGPLLVGVGRLERIKGFDLLIEAMAEVRRRLPARLVLVGEGSERDRLRQRVSALGLDGAVRLVGFRDDPGPWIAAADLLVLPSRTEAWPNVIGEAMAAGTPVVATRCSPGVEQFLAGGGAGRLVPPEDPVALAAAIVELLADPEARAALARAGRDRVRALAPEVVTRRYEAALARALDGASGP